jgi:hypothetical protein
MLPKAEMSTAACFLRDSGGKAGAEVESGSDSVPDAGIAVSGIVWVCVAISDLPVHI